MSDLFLLSEERIRSIEHYFQLSHGIALLAEGNHYNLSDATLDQGWVKSGFFTNDSCTCGPDEFKPLPWTTPITTS